MDFDDYIQTKKAAVYAAFLAQMVAGIGKGCELSDQEMRHAIACANSLFVQWQRIAEVS